MGLDVGVQVGLLVAPVRAEGASKRLVLRVGEDVVAEVIFLEGAVGALGA